MAGEVIQDQLVGGELQREKSTRTDYPRSNMNKVRIKPLLKKYYSLHSSHYLYVDKISSIFDIFPMRVQTCGVVVLNPSELINWKNSSGSQ
jgi:hypothetical protein